MVNGILIGGIFLILAISVGWAMLRGLAKARIRGISMIACGVLAVLLALLTRSFLVTDTMMESNIVGTHFELQQHLEAHLAQKLSPSNKFA